MMGSRALVSALLGSMLTLPSMCNVYKSDVTKFCDAEQLSQGSFKGDKAQLYTWMERHAASSDGIVLVASLESKDARGLSNQLREEARKADLPSCTLADQAEMVAKDEEFRADMVNLCAGSALRDDGSIARLDVVSVDDYERLRVIKLWTNTNTKSPDTRAIVAKFDALLPQQRGPLLRAEAAKVGVTSCALASTLAASAPPPPIPAGQLAKPTFTVSKVEAPGKADALIAYSLTSGDTATGINTCYGDALAGAPTLAGSIVLQMSFDANGASSGVKDAGSSLPPVVVGCVINVVQKMALPAVPHPERAKKGTGVVNVAGISATATLDCAPTTGPGWTATVGSTKPSGRHR